MARANLAALAPFDGDVAFVTRGDELVARLQQVVDHTNRQHVDDLPETLQELCYQKGLLYLALKMINEAGHGVHADELPLAGKYNLALLYKNRGKEGPNPPAAPGA